MFWNLPNKADYARTFLKAWRYYGAGRCAKTPNVFSSHVLGGSVATSCNTAFKAWSAIGVFQTAYAALEAAAIRRPSRKIRSGLLIAVIFPFHSRRRVVRDELFSTKNINWEIKGKPWNRNINYIVKRKQLPRKILDLGTIFCGNMW